MKLLVSPEEVWFQIALPGESKDVLKRYKKMTDVEKGALRSKAASLYQEQSRKYRTSKSMTPADREWLETVLKEGTTSDKVSAMLLQVQECPFYGLDWIAKLLVMASSDSRHESFPAMEALRDVFCQILPPRALNRPLLAWSARVMTDDKELTPASALLLFYFEDVLKQSYMEYLKLLEILLHDNLSNCRERAMRSLYELCLADKLEHGEAALRLLVNKLGDPERKIASRVVYYLQCIVEKNEHLTLPIAKMVQNEAVRPNGANDKLAFYGLTFFSQVRLNEDSPEVTEVLLDTYQQHLQLFLKKLEETASAKRKQLKTRKRRRPDDDNGQSEEDEVPRTVKVVLTGLTRAIPFARSSGANSVGEYAKKLVAIAGKIRSYPTLLQAISLVFQIFALGEAATDESLQILSEICCKYLLDYSRLAETTASHPKLFKILYKIFCAMGECSLASASTHLGRIVAAMLDVSVMVSNAAFPAAALLLVNEAFSMKPGLRLAITFPEDETEGENKKIGCFWHLNALTKHYHPTVVRYAKTLLPTGDLIDIGNEPDDPFTAMSSSAFLDSLIDGSLLKAA